MDFSKILDFILIILTIVVGYLMNYFKTHSDVSEKAVKYIGEAEDVYKEATKAGTTKMNYVIDKLADEVPGILKMVFTREVLQTIAQNIFDSIRVYADVTVEKVITTISTME